MNIVEESRCPIMVNFMVLNFVVSELPRRPVYHRPNVGLALLFLKPNSLSYKFSKSHLSLNYRIRGYQG